MLVTVVLVMVLTLPKVWLKPTLDEREFVVLMEDDVSREKRQTQIFDIIHQAIENYANCAHEHLAPLKALANYKRYETLIYPEHNSASAETILGASQQQNKGNIKCTKVNLCSVVNQTQVISGHNVNEPTVLGKAFHPEASSFKKNKGYNRLPVYGSNRLSLNRTMGTKNSSNKNQNNLSFSALNQAFLSKLFNIPETSTKLSTQDVLGSKLEATKTFSNIKSCTCSKKSTEKPPDVIENTDSYIDEDQTTKAQTFTEPEPILGINITKAVTTFGKIKSCGCLKKTTPKTDLGSNLSTENSTILEITTTSDYQLIKTNETKSSSEPILGSQLQQNETENNNFTNQEVKTTTPTSAAVLSSAFDIKKTSKDCNCSKKDPMSNQNLNLLVLQLDLKAQNESKENLQKILKDLKALKSLMKLTDKSVEQTETTVIKSKAFSSTTMTPKSTTDPILAAEPAHVAVKASSVDLNETELKNSTENHNKKNNLDIPKVPSSNNISVGQNYENIKSDNKFPKSPISLTNTTNLPLTLHDSNKSKEFSTKLSSNQTKVDEIIAVKSSPPLQLNITNSQDLERITNELNTIVSSMANKTLLGNSTNLEDTGSLKNTNITIANKTTLTTNNHTLSEHNSNLTNSNVNLGQTMAILNNSMVPDRTQKDVNSTITISISSNGSFKKIELEHESDKSSNKNIEINEKEKMNLNSPKVRSIDMSGTSAKYINHLKTFRRKDTYVEPILSEIYSGRPKLKSKSPLSIFWHTIEKKPQKSENIYLQNWETFQSNDFEDYNYDSRGDQENFSSSLEDCEDYEDSSEEIEKREINENKSNKRLCKRNVLIT